MHPVGVVIVGAGPGGYAAAMALAKNGFKDIRVLEQAASSNTFNPAKGFTYSITPTGKNVLRHFGMDKIDQVGVTREVLGVKRCTPNGKITRVSMAGQKQEPSKKLDVTTAATWVPRHDLNSALHKHVAERFSDSVKVEFGVKIVDVLIPQAPGQPLGVIVASVQGQHASTDRKQYNCRLLVGADGANSAVRHALMHAHPGTGWEMKAKHSASTGLQFKVLTLAPCPKLSDAVGVLHSTECLSFAGQSVEGEAPLSLGIFPVKDNSQPRTANLILWPEHNFWKIREPEELYKYLEAAFPYAQYMRDVVSSADAERFLGTAPGQFRPPQTCSRLCAFFDDSKHVEVSKADPASSITGGAAVILGDAAHHFPPDLGQGVNSTFLDAFTLSRCLERFAGDCAAALEEYEAIRMPENQALIELMRFGYPRQYRQKGTEVGQVIDKFNFASRMALAWALPFLFSKPAALLVYEGVSPEDHSNPSAYDSLYQNVLDKAEVLGKVSGAIN